MKLSAQVPNLNDSGTYYDRLKSYFLQYPITPADTAEGGIKEDFRRAAMIWAPRLWPHGDSKKGATAFNNYVANYNNGGGTRLSLNTTDPFWTPLGPIGNVNAQLYTGRFARNNALMLCEPRLQLGGPTNAWVKSSYDIFNNFTAENLSKITIDILVFQAGNETLVDTAGQEKIAKLLPNAKIIKIENAKHEMLVEIEDIRTQVGHHIDEYLKAVLI